MDPNEEETTPSAQASAVRVRNKPNYPGPDPNLKYPLNIIYCAECGMPVELCEYSQHPDACKEWLNKNHPDFYTKMNNLQMNESGENEGEGDKKSAHQKRGGKGMPKAKKERVPSKVIVSKQQRKGNKYVTIIAGLGANEIDIEVAKKFFANKFSCGCSKGEHDELIIQGDVVDSLFDVIPEKFPQISQDMIEEKESK